MTDKAHPPGSCLLGGDCDHVEPRLAPCMVIPDQEWEDPLPCSNCKRPLSEHTGIVCPVEPLPDVQLSDEQMERSLVVYNEICGDGQALAARLIVHLQDENMRLREDIVRTESAHTVVMAENTHYKQRAADLREKYLALLEQRAAQPPSPDDCPKGGAHEWVHRRGHTNSFCDKCGFFPGPSQLPRAINCGRCATPDYCNDIRGLCCNVQAPTPTTGDGAK